MRKIPTREQLAEAARRQALAEQDQESEYDLEEDPRYYDTRLPTSSRRYQSIPDVTTTKGRVMVVEHYHDQPLRAHRTQLPPPRPTAERYTDEVGKQSPKPIDTYIHCCSRRWYACNGSVISGFLQARLLGYRPQKMILPTADPDTFR